MLKVTSMKYKMRLFFSPPCHNNSKKRKCLFLLCGYKTFSHSVLWICMNIVFFSCSGNLKCQGDYCFQQRNVSRCAYQDSSSSLMPTNDFEHSQKKKKRNVNIDLPFISLKHLIVISSWSAREAETQWWQAESHFRSWAPQQWHFQFSSSFMRTSDVIRLSSGAK